MVLKASQSELRVLIRTQLPISRKHWHGCGWLWRKGTWSVSLAIWARLSVDAWSIEPRLVAAGPRKACGDRVQEETPALAVASTHVVVGQVLMV
jgi:hypothetical protein